MTAWRSLWLAVLCLGVACKKDDSPPLRTLPSPCGPPELVKPLAARGYFPPRPQADVGGTLFFAMGTEETVGRLWRSNGTAEGTVAVKQIFPSDSYYCPYPTRPWYCPGRPSPAWLTELNGTLFFLAINALGEGPELWRSDGTPEGTVPVKDVVPPTNLSNVRDMIRAGGLLFFVSLEFGHSPRLWRSDGTPDGTFLLDVASPQVNTVRTMAVVGETLFFTADGGSGYELWKSDGTPEGTVLVKDLAPGVTSSLPDELTEVNGVLFFSAESGSGGRELWKSDGTPEGTVLVRGGSEGSGNFLPTSLVALNGKLFFSAYEESSGHELWQSDGTPEGTVLLRDIYPGPTGSGPSSSSLLDSGPYNLTTAADQVFLSARDEGNGLELWRTDGTPAGTFRVTDVHPGTQDSYLYTPTPVGRTVFFTTMKIVNGNVTSLWLSDGTPEGSVSFEGLVDPTILGSTSDRFYFASGHESLGYGLWSIPLCDSLSQIP